MTATQGVLLRYRGGEVYALPTAARHVWRVAGVEVRVDIVATHPVHNDVIGLETAATLAGAAKRRRGECRAREDARLARVTLEMERTPKRPAKRTGKAKAKAKGEAMSTEHTAGLTVDARTWAKGATT